MLHIVRWDASTHTAQAIPPEELPATIADVGEHVYWIDMDDPTPAEEERVFKTFHAVHPLTVEDITKPRRTPNEGAHLPKVEEFPDYLFVIVNPLPPDVCRVPLAPLSPGGRGGPPPQPSPRSPLPPRIDVHPTTGRAAVRHHRRRTRPSRRK